MDKNKSGGQKKSAGSCQAEKKGGEVSRGWITGWHVFKSTNLDGWWVLKRSCNGIYDCQLTLAEVIQGLC